MKYRNVAEADEALDILIKGCGVRLHNNNAGKRNVMLLPKFPRHLLDKLIAKGEPWPFVIEISPSP